MLAAEGMPRHFTISVPAGEAMVKTVELDDATLTIKGERKAEQEEKAEFWAERLAQVITEYLAV